MVGNENIKLKSLTFSSDLRGNDDNAEVDLTHVTILVGANNSGKSTALKDIQRIAKNLSSTVIKDFSLLNVPEKRQALEALEPFRAPSQEYDHHKRDNRQVYNNTNTEDNEANNVAELSLASIDHLDKERFKREFSKLFIQNFGGRKRFELSSDQSDADLNEKPYPNHLVALLADNYKRKEFNDLVHNIFGFYPLLDTMNRSTIKIKTNKERPQSYEDEGARTKPEIQRLMKEGIHISEMGDGIQCFVGLLAGITGSSSTIFLIDEPEAFLSPPIARETGRVLSRLAKKLDISLVLATHSSHIVLGCLDEAKDTNIIRLINDEENRQVTVLDSSKIEGMSKDPVLKNSHIIQSIFHPSVCITLCETKRIVYDELNSSKNICKDMYFLSTATSYLDQLVDPLRKLRIPTACIIDLHLFTKDYINKLSEVCGVPPETIEECKTTFASAIQNLEHSNKENVDDISEQIIKGKTQKLLLILEEYGLFVEPLYMGSEDTINLFYEWELQALPDQGRDKLNYFLSSQSDHKNTLSFLKKVANWINNPNRKGLCI